jgi:anti-anti-sigma factor
MNVTTEVTKRAVIHRLSGRLDTASSPAAEQAILQALRPDQSRVILDMRNVDYVSSAGLRVVLLAAKQAKSAQGTLALFGMQPGVREVFDISGFSRILSILPGEAEAIAQVAG